MKGVVRACLEVVLSKQFVGIATNAIVATMAVEGRGGKEGKGGGGGGGGVLGRDFFTFGLYQVSEEAGRREACGIGRPEFVLRACLILFCSHLVSLFTEEFMSSTIELMESIEGFPMVW